MKKAISIFSTLLLMSFLFFSCNNEPDPCENVLCLNGGTCVSGLCDCPPGWGGSQCADELTPTKIKITKVVLTKFPYYDANGNEWDPDDHSGPDLYIRVVRGKKEIYKYPKQIWDVKINQEYTFNLSSAPIVFTKELETKHKLQLWDYEEYDNDNFMGEYEFIPFLAGKNFPEKVDIGDHWSEVGFTIYLKYEFN